MGDESLKTKVSINATIRATILARISLVYGADCAPDIMANVEALLASYDHSIAPKQCGWSEKDALLITYADSLVGEQPPLIVLNNFLQQEIGDLITYVHLLPFYPFSSDDGFAVQDFRAVRPDLGTWDNLIAMSTHYRLVYDAVINHVSESSNYMQEYRTGNPAFADFFVALEPDTDTSAVLRTRNLPLLHDYPTHDGVKWLWTTFSRDQLDLNYANPAVLLEILDVLLFYARQGASMIRLDAIPYMWKELGTSCAHLPQTHELIKLIRDQYTVVSPHMLLLTETNVPHQENVTYFGDRGDEAQMIYNFSLAPLILWSLLTGDATALTTWAGGIKWISEHATYLNITATHDGIGMRPTEGILSEAARAKLVQLASEHHGAVTGKRNPDGSISPYELNLNYFDAVNDPASDEPVETQIQRFLVSQAIPMALMGIPGIYIHSLLGSRNDTDGVRRTGMARSINREQLRIEALSEDLHFSTSLRSRVFTEMKHLLRLRAEQSAFHPDAAQEIIDRGAALFVVLRHNASTQETIVAVHNMTNQPVAVSMIDLGLSPANDLLTDEYFIKSTIPLAPYQVRWLKKICP